MAVDYLNLRQAGCELDAAELSLPGDNNAG